MFCIPYLCLVAALGLLAFLYSNTTKVDYKNAFVVGGTCLFLFFFGFRGYIMSDWIIYYDLFYETTIYDLDIHNLFSFNSIEPGFSLLIIFCKSLFRDFHFFVFVSTLINTILLLRFLYKYTDNILLGLMLFIIFEGLTIMVNLMRNSIAILLFLNAIGYLTSRKPIKYFSLCILATSFHFSALIYFPLYFFFHLRMPRWAFIIIIIAFNIIYLGHVPIVSKMLILTGLDADKTDKIVAYTQKLVTTSKLSIGYLERLFTSILVICYYDRLYEIRKECSVFINGFIMYIAFLFVFSDFPIVAHRMGNLFAYSYWILWADLIKCFVIENNRRLFASFVYLYCLFRIIGSTQLPDFEYDNVLFGAKSYEERLYIHNKTFEETF